MVTRPAGTSCSASRRRFKSLTLSDACRVILMSLGRVDILILTTTGSPVGTMSMVGGSKSLLPLDFDDFRLLCLDLLLPLLILRLMPLEAEVELGMSCSRFVPLSISLESSVSAAVRGVRGAGGPEGCVRGGEAEPTMLVGLLMQYLGRT